MVVAALVVSLAAMPTSASADRKPFAGPDAYEHVPRHHAYRLDDVRIAVTPDYRSRSIAGDVVNTVTTIDDRLDHIDLDAANLAFSFVGTRDGRRLRYRTFGETLRVLLPGAVPAGTRLAIRTVYRTHPSAGFYFVEPDAGYPDLPYEIWTQGEAQDNRYWFPTYDELDEKATSETLTTLPEGQQVMSNGRLVNVSHDLRRRTVTYDWREAVPHATYLISIVGGEFRTASEKLGALPIEYFAPRGQERRLAFDFRHTPDMISFLDGETGVPYPYEKFAQSAVVNFTYGGMENVSAVTHSSRTLHDPAQEIDVTSDALIAHELSHQWWGDLVTCASWGDFWLNEGFATYYEARYAEHAHGRDAYDLRRLDWQSSIFKADRRYRRPLVTQFYAHPFDLADAVSYDKGAWVLHMLRSVLGDEAFRAAQHAYLAAYRERNATTRQWEAAVEASAGTDLHWFVDEWAFAAGWPEYDVRYRYDTAARSVRLSVRQTQSRSWGTPAVFVMPVDVLLMYPDGSSTVAHVRDDRREQSFDVPSPLAPAMVLFDPGRNILSTQRFHKTRDEWAFQSSHAAGVLDRLAAIRALAEDRSATQAQLHAAIEAARAERDEDARAEAVTSLVDAGRRPPVRAALVAAMHDRSAHVRAAAAAALGGIPYGADSAAALTAAVRRDPSEVTKAKAIASLAALRAPGLMPLLDAAVTVRSHREVIRAAALAAYATMLGTRAVATEMQYARYGEPPDSRVAAIEALGDVGKGNHTVTGYLGSMLDDPNFFVARAAADALGRLGDPAAVPALARVAQTNENYRLRESARANIRRIAGVKHG